MIVHQHESPVEWADEVTPKSKYFNDTYRCILRNIENPELPARDLGVVRGNEVYLKGTGLLNPRPLWAGQEHWSVLETGFGLGLNFLCTWAHWLSLPSHLRPKRLSFVSVEKYPVSINDLVRSASPWPELSRLALQLKEQWFGLVPGFHHLKFEGGAVTLLLCMGEVQTALHDLQMRADTVFLDGFSPEVNPQMWTHKILGRISQLAKPSAQLATWCVSSTVIKSLEILGFECHKKTELSLNLERLEATYKAFKPRRRLQLQLHPHIKSVLMPLSSAPAPRRCAVIGAGLAGACAAYAMAKRGWSVAVFDTEPAPAQGASGVPVGIFSTQLSADDNASSKLSRAGVRATHQLLKEVMPRSLGEHWDISGVLEITPTNVTVNSSIKSVGGISKKRTPDPSSFEIFQTSQGRDWCELDQRHTGHQFLKGSTLDATKHAVLPNVWHKRGGWVDPSQLIEAILKTQGLEFYGQTKITKITKINLHKNSSSRVDVDCTQSAELPAPLWTLEGPSTTNPLGNDQPLCVSLQDLNEMRFEQVILTNAAGVDTLLSPLIKGYEERALLESTYGQLSWGELPNTACKDLNNFPLNGEGSFLVRPSQDNNLMSRWYAGSTFERISQQISFTNSTLPHGSNTLKRHALNLQKLKGLYPNACDAVLEHLGQSNPGEVALDNPSLKAWSQWRCNTRNRIPWAEDFCGPGLDESSTQSAKSTNLKGLSVLAGLGSKGLALAPLCAEILAASIHLEPVPIEGHLLKKIRKFNT